MIFIYVLVIETYSKNITTFVYLLFTNENIKISYLDELLLNVHVRNVEYIEYGCERLSGTLYMTIFRLVFAPDNEIENNNLVRILEILGRSS